MLRLSSVSARGQFGWPVVRPVFGLTQGRSGTVVALPQSPAPWVGDHSADIPVRTRASRVSAPLTSGVRQALRRVPQVLREDGFATDSALCAEFGIDLRELRTAVAILYRQRRADRIGIYIVAPASPRTPVALPDAAGQAA